MRGDPARDVDADRAQLPRRGPDAGAPLDPLRPDAVARGDADHQLLDRPDVLADVLAVGLQVQDRVPDDLSGAVVGDVAAAVRLEELESALPAARRGGQRMFAAFAPRPSVITRGCSSRSRVSGRRPCAARPDQQLLHGEAVVVLDASEPADVQRAGHARHCSQRAAAGARRGGEPRAAPRAARAAARARSGTRRRRATRAAGRASSPPPRWRRSLPRGARARSSSSSRAVHRPQACSRERMQLQRVALLPLLDLALVAVARRVVARSARRCGRSRLDEASGRRRCARAPPPPAPRGRRRARRCRRPARRGSRRRRALIRDRSLTPSAAPSGTLIAQWLFWQTNTHRRLEDAGEVHRDVEVAARWSRRRP